MQQFFESRWSKQMFPIPMRGNEMQQFFESRWSKQMFPIPMRGNEIGTA